MPPQDRRRVEHADHTEKARPQLGQPHQQRAIAAPKRKTCRSSPQGDIELMTEKEVLGLKPAPDADGVYHPAMFNDRLLLGLKGTMSESELHVLRERLLGGIRNKAARGELRRGLPVGFVWGDEDGEVRFHPDEAVCVAIRTVFARFAELGSVRRVWLWLRTEGLSFPMQTRYGGGVRSVDPS